MNIRILSQKTDIAIRQLRYVLDHELVPERTWFVDEHTVGRARNFDDITAIFIACAAYLLDAGYKREAVRSLIGAIGKIMPTGRNPLHLPVIANVVSGQGTAKVQFADGRYVRWIIGRSTGDWIDPGPRAKSKPDLTPRVIVELNVGEIRDQIRET
jgi:hypothetical protein